MTEKVSEKEDLPSTSTFKSGPREFIQGTDKNQIKSKNFINTDKCK